MLIVSAILSLVPTYNYRRGFTYASGIIYLFAISLIDVCFITIFVLLVLRFVRLGPVSSHNKITLYAAAASTPFYLVFFIYLFLVGFGIDGLQDYRSNPAMFRAFMSVFVELMIVVCFLVAGYATPKQAFADIEEAKPRRQWYKLGRRVEVGRASH